MVAMFLNYFLQKLYLRKVEHIIRLYYNVIFHTLKFMALVSQQRHTFAFPPCFYCYFEELRNYKVDEAFYGMTLTQNFGIICHMVKKSRLNVLLNKSPAMNLFCFLLNIFVKHLLQNSQINVLITSKY
jgi:hypothetical protein